MEAALFTLDVVLILVLILAVRKADRSADAHPGLGFFSYLEAKTDPVQKGLRRRKDRDHA